MSTPEFGSDMWNITDSIDRHSNPNSQNQHLNSPTQSPPFIFTSSTSVSSTIIQVDQFSIPSQSGELEENENLVEIKDDEDGLVENFYPIGQICHKSFHVCLF